MLVDKHASAEVKPRVGILGVSKSVEPIVREAGGLVDCMEPWVGAQEHVRQTEARDASPDTSEASP